ncbi:major facilitator superfamily MFS_1 [Castellaniella defragrans 65Phen]|uniref:Major facilitator superfamily MFS_1 n=2 Tax=Castellaniella defragrans TaxID=75697 RepID=W8X1B6_CASD6|nr:MFS transporter [Castellaniella defragrans]KAB0622655.1 MFS transporter [Castellaniella defragrans]MBB6082014.1 putative MFS family arabinose efflux permease [Castellaniella defragrans]CDM23082.1 major facilitator superfamily MFS_1 [Castellaniella defragrans 65Phen]
MPQTVPEPRPSETHAAVRAALFLVLVGMCAALHIWKVPPALPQLQAELRLSLVESGFLLSAVQLGGLILGLPVALAAERIGLRRCIVAGLAILAVSSMLGAWLDSSLLVLLFRAAEGCGVLMIAMPIPALIRRLVPPDRLSRIMGLWGSYMPLGTVVILLAGSWILSLGSWQLLWWLLAALTLGCLLLTLRLVPPDPAADPGRPHDSVAQLVRATLGSVNVWLVALIFGLYAGQWMAVIGFLPTIYAAQGVGGTTAGLLTAIVAGANAIGNLSAGRLLHHGVAAWQLLVTGLATMILCAWAAFGAGLPASGQFVAVLVFSMMGGLVPTTLFVLGLTLTPTPRTASATIGWMQQCSSLGQFAGPPFVAWVVNRAGGDWQWTWTATAAFAAAGIVLSVLIGLRTRPRNATPRDATR